MHHFDSDDGYGFQRPADSVSVTRFQHIPQHLAEAMAQPTEQARPAPTRVCGDSLRITNGDAEASSGGVTRHVVSFGGTKGGSVVATLMGVGNAQTVELVPGDATTRTNIRVAMREGLLTRNAAGHLEDAADQRRRVDAWNADAARPAAQPDDPGADVFSPQQDQQWAREIEPLPQHTYDSTQARAVSFVAHGVGSLDSMAATLARDAGIPPEQARGTIENGIALYQQAADRALGRVGLTGDSLEAFYDHARGRPGQLQDAIHRLVLQRDPSGFTRMAREWQATTQAKG
ncbi:hypothetical protein [Rubrivivax gelatinosus]|uniref:hypothetical protein n=1 Tax=Rubrivivax gelatinosus TaxID=28068 RepID=UPI0005C19863|nr:hypothetical protein [Rubrivivax gelatinosus]MBG6078701.1 hypothetical protein [Rubrivivax gelatinosus]